MSDLQDPLQESDQVSQGSAQSAPDKKIVFGVRKPTEETSPITGLPLIIEAPFPNERTLRWLPEGVRPDLENRTDAIAVYSVGPGDEIDQVQGELRSSSENAAIIVSQEVLLKVSEHVSQSLERELGGFLLGNRYRCPNTRCEYVIIDQCSPAKFTESTNVRLAFTHEAWAQLSDELSGKFLGKLLIGWYHSHPRLDVFLSSHDLEIQRERFAEPWMVALVLEPEKHHGGFFGQRDGRVSPNFPVEFFELLERNSRQSVLAWENYNAVDPATNAAPVLSETNTATPGGSSSPGIQGVRDARSRKVPRRSKGRLLFRVGLVVVLLGAVAAAVVNRTFVRTWVRNRINGLMAPAPTPSPSVAPGPSSQAQPESSSSSNQTSITPQPEAAPSTETTTPRHTASPNPSPAVGTQPASTK